MPVIGTGTATQRGSHYDVVAARTEVRYTKSPLYAVRRTKMRYRFGCGGQKT